MGFYQWLYEWWTGFVVMAGGALFIWLSLLLLGEYRRAFMASPMSVMSLDVLLSIGLIAGALFLAGGFVLLVGLLFSSLVDLWQAARLTLGV
jgi:hypothetical protein